MNLLDLLELQYGGPGSGCNPDVGDCGRPPGPGHPEDHSDGEEIGTRENPIHAKSIMEAVLAIKKGKIVEFGTTKEVHVLLERLSEIAKTAKEAGRKAEKYDLCNVTVKNTNIFCAEHKGIDRIHMPQFGGRTRPGSEADKLEHNKDGQIDATKEFIAHLASLGIKTNEEQEKAAFLRASQMELIGAKVAGMMTAKGYDPGKRPIFISRDNYVIDGHHRWAAVVGRDSEDGKFGDLKMNAIRVDAPISEVLKIATEWTEKFGILPEGT
jgi:hypothetical protein